MDEISDSNILMYEYKLYSSIILISIILIISKIIRIKQILSFSIRYAIINFELL